MYQGKVRGEVAKIVAGGAGSRAVSGGYANSLAYHEIFFKSLRIYDSK